MTKVTIFSDGACSPNPGKGGCAAILVHGDQIKTISKGFKKTTNNRMELMGLIIGVEALKKTCEILAYSDSMYVVNPFTKNWLNGWISRDFANIKNIDLWKRLLLALEPHTITIKWVKAHCGIEMNEMADVAAVKARNGHLEDDVIPPGEQLSLLTA